VLRHISNVHGGTGPPLGRVCEDVPPVSLHVSGTSAGLHGGAGGVVVVVVVVRVTAAVRWAGSDSG